MILSALLVLIIWRNAGMYEQARVTSVRAADEIGLRAAALEAWEPELRGVTAVTATPTLWILHTT